MFTTEMTLNQLPGDLNSIIFMSEILPTLILTVGGVFAFWIGTRTYLRMKQTGSPNELAKISESLDLLHDSLDDIRAALHSQSDEVRELSGRIEFAERLLTKARDEDRL
jgi:hypothetical protein